MEGALDELEAELGRSAEGLRAAGSRAERLTSEVAALRARCGESEGEVAALRAELATAHRRRDEELRDLCLISRQLEELRVSSRGQATRIRLRGLREAAELSARLSFATGERGEAQRERVLAALEAAIERVGAEWDAEVPATPLRRELAETGGATKAGPAGRRRVSVDVGPFADFSQLVRFEDAANAIGATGDISIKRFSEGRARIDMALSQPVDLLRELEERCDLEFEVRSTGDDEIVLDVS